MENTEKEQVKFVKNILNGKNLKALTSLKKIILIKCANKIKDTLNN